MTLPHATSSLFSIRANLETARSLPARRACQALAGGARRRSRQTPSMGTAVLSGVFDMSSLPSPRRPRGPLTYSKNGLPSSHGGRGRARFRPRASARMAPPIGHVRPRGLARPSGRFDGVLFAHPRVPTGTDEVLATFPPGERARFARPCGVGALDRTRGRFRRGARVGAAQANAVYRPFGRSIFSARRIRPLRTA